MRINKRAVVYTLVSVDNPDTVGNSFIGITSYFEFNGVQFFFDELYSSLVREIQLVENTLTVTTKNTVYIFERKEIND